MIQTEATETVKKNRFTNHKMPPRNENYEDKIFCPHKFGKKEKKEDKNKWNKQQHTEVLGRNVTEEKYK